MHTHLLLPIEEACERLQLGRSTLYDLIRSGELASVKVGRRRLIPAAALETFVENLSTGAA